MLSIKSLRRANYNSFFKVGFGREIITSPLGTALYGYPKVRYAESVHDALYVTAFAFKKGDVKAIMISADICAFGIEESFLLRKLIAEATGVPCENITLSAIHTHSGPCTRMSVGWDERNDDYINEILNLMTLKAAKAAVANMTDAVMGIGVTESEVGINRRQKNLDGEVIPGQNPWGIFNKTMTVRAFKSIKEYSEPAFDVINDTVRLPYLPLMSYEDAKAKLLELGDVENAVGRPKKAADNYLSVMNVYEKNLEIKDALSYDVSVISLGSVAFCPFPFEIFSEIAIRIAHHSPYQHTLILNNTNGALAYFPTKSEISLGGYEVFMFNHFQTYNLPDDSDTTAVKEYVRILNALKAKQK